VVLRWVSLGDSIEAHQVSIPVMVNVTDASDAAAAPAESAVTEEVVVLRSAAARDEARRLADRGDVAAARNLLSASAAALRSQAGASSRPDELLAEADRLDRLAVAATDYDESVSKRLHYGSRDIRHRRER
jgi:hypothetical protein